MPDPGGKTTLFAVLGGVASGKSTVARLLAGKHGVVLVGDVYAHQVLTLPDTATWISEEFGPKTISEDGQPDRAELARQVFSDPSKLKALEDWIHPRVRARISSDLAGARAQAVSRIVLDVPLILESDGLAEIREQVDHWVFLDVSLEERERRAGTQRGWEPGEVARREAAQMPILEKRNAADVVIDASRSLEHIERDVQAYLKANGL